jgi:hypothetical protein
MRPESGPVIQGKSKPCIFRISNIQILKDFLTGNAAQVQGKIKALNAIIFFTGKVTLESGYDLSYQMLSAYRLRLENTLT